MTENRINRPNFITGLLLILLGLFFLGAQLGYICWENLWPLILIIGGALFFLGFFLNPKHYGLLMPGSVLTIVGLLFLYTNSGRWYAMEYLWPIVILAPGIGFVLMYLFGPKRNGFWIPAVILVTMALIFFVRFWCVLRYWPVILILIGFYILINAGKKKARAESKGSADISDSRLPSDKGQ